jgi:limonene-1,2-epoxide hydrolase
MQEWVLFIIGSFGNLGGRFIVERLDTFRDGTEFMKTRLIGTGE